MNAQEWQDEIAYCATLVATQGNKDVPKRLVEAYLAMQRRTADRTGFTDAGSALAKLETQWANRGGR